MARVPETKYILKPIGGKRDVTSSQRRRQKHKPCKPSWKFSDGLSTEAQLAMRMAKEESVYNPSAETETDSVLTLSEQTVSQRVHPSVHVSRCKRQSYDSGIEGTSSNIENLNNSSATDDKIQRPTSRLSVRTTSTHSELYAQRSTTRMRMDITDNNFSWDKESKMPLGGGKLESTLELVEVVNADAPEDCRYSEDTMAELRRINAVDKCMVWMEANEHNQFMDDVYDRGSSDDDMDHV